MRNKILVVVAIIVTVGLVGLYLVNKLFKIVDLSTISISTGDNLEKDKVKVKRGVYTINRKNDEELFTNYKGRIVYDGHQVGLLKTDYGENDFLITYDDKYYFQFRHFIFNGTYQHTYNFKLTQQADTLFIQADIVGEDKMRFKKPMHLIKDAKFLRCNAPIDSGKVLYNMIELK